MNYLVKIMFRHYIYNLYKKYITNKMMLKKKSKKKKRKKLPSIHFNFYYIIIVF